VCYSDDKNQVFLMDVSIKNALKICRFSKENFLDSKIQLQQSVVAVLSEQP